MEDPKLKLLIAVLVEWINDELAEHRIIVQNLDEDIYDGQVLQKLLGKISLKQLNLLTTIVDFSTIVAIAIIL